MKWEEIDKMTGRIINLTKLVIPVLYLQIIFPQEFSTDRFLVKLTNYAYENSTYNIDINNMNGSITGINSLESLIQEQEITNIVKSYNNAQDKLLASQLGLNRWYVFSVLNEFDIETTIEEFNNNEYVEIATPDYLLYPTNVIPNDPYYEDNWGFNNYSIFPKCETDCDPSSCHYCGEYNENYVGLPGFDTDIETAWNSLTNFGNPNINIAILDNGVDYNHEDLFENIWINPNVANDGLGEDANENGTFENYPIEDGGDLGDSNSDNCPGVCETDDDYDGVVDEDSNGCGCAVDLNNDGEFDDSDWYSPDGCDPSTFTIGSECLKMIEDNWVIDFYLDDMDNDDDENSYNDDVIGYDFGSNDSDPFDNCNSPSNPKDPGHGTACAGIAAGVTNNDIGIAGNAVNILSLQSGNNLISFYSLPIFLEDSEIVEPPLELMMNYLGGNALQISAELLSSVHLDTDGDGIPDFWEGELQFINRTSGYWLKVEEDDKLPILGSSTPIGLNYYLHTGQNLISFPNSGKIPISEGIPDEFEEYFISIIGEGAAAFQINPFNWIGSLTHFSGGKGYWSNVTSDFEFSFIIPEEIEINGEFIDPLNIPLQFNYHQSTLQGFYFIRDVLLDGSSIDSNDWMIAYYNSIPIGARNWFGNYSDLPVMGNDNSKWTEGYILEGEIPIFKIYDSSEEKLYNANPSGIGEGGLEWSNFKIVLIDSLIVTTGCTDPDAINYNPDANNENESCVYLMGDLNQDEVLNILDLVILIHIITGGIDPIIYQIAAGDMNEDGELDVLDVIILRTQLLSRRPSGVNLARNNGQQNLFIQSSESLDRSDSEVFEIVLSTDEEITGIHLEFVVDTSIFIESTIGYDINYWSYEDSLRIDTLAFVTHPEDTVYILPGEHIIAIFIFESDLSRGNTNPMEFINGLMVDNSENVITISVGASDNSDLFIPSEFSLYNIYPNPFNPITTITYELPEESYVTISVYDLSGRKLTDIVNSTKLAGIYTIQWDAEDYPSGIYFVKMMTDDYTKTQKVMLVK